MLVEKGSALFLADIHENDSNSILKSIRHRNLKTVIEKHIKEVDIVGFLGDNFNSNSPSFLLVQDICQILSSFREWYSKIVICNGNHDSLALSTSPLHPFCTGAGIRHVASEEYFRPPFIFRGWNTAKPIRNSTEFRFWCGHVALELPPHLTGNGRYSPDSLKELGYEAYMLGDLHSAEDFGNVHSIGCFAPVNFSDVDKKACYGILEWNEKGYELTRHYIDYPVYKIFKLNYSTDIVELIARLKDEITGNCVRIDITDSLLVDSELKNKLTEVVGSFKPIQFKIDFIGKVEMKSKVQISIESLDKFIEEKTEDWPKNVKEYFEKNK